MAVETGSWISDLVPAQPTGTSVVSEGAGHLRIIKSILQLSFPNVNDDVNAIHTKATAPTSTSAGLLWFDTTANELKLRNEADSAWITLAIDPTTNYGLVGSKRLIGIGHNYRSGYTDITSTSMTDSGLSITYTKVNATSDLYVDVATEARLSSGWGSNNTQSGFIRLVYSTSTTTGIVPATDDNANYMKETGMEVSSGTAQLGSGVGYHWKITGLAAAAYTFKLQGKVANTDGSLEFNDGTIKIMEVST